MAVSFFHPQNVPAQKNVLGTFDTAVFLQNVPATMQNVPAKRADKWRNDAMFLLFLLFLQFFTSYRKKFLFFFQMDEVQHPEKKRVKE